MKKMKYIAIILFLAFSVSCSRRVESRISDQKREGIETQIAKLVKSMTLEEKVGQMTQIAIDVITFGPDSANTYEPVRLDHEMLEIAFAKYQVGSVLNTPNGIVLNAREWNEIVKEIQDFAIPRSRFAIPVLYGLDMIHGASYVNGATFFPQQIGMAATWNAKLIEKAGEITAYETRAAGVAWSFSPVMDLGIDPRWPRFWETFGEDPLLASVMGQHFIKGMEGKNNDLSDKDRIASCLKHFLGYSQPLSGKDRTPAWIPENKLREYHLPPFANALKAGSLTVMLNSGEINGIPVHASKYFVTDLLKKELGFQGFVVSDWRDIENLHVRHKVAASQKEAVKLAVNAGVDMSMVPHNFRFTDYLICLVKEGEVPIERIDDAVTRILRVKFLLGLFETPYTQADDYPDFASKEFAQVALQAASESVTLLKNDNNLLPIPKNARILLGGPAANVMRPLNGGWSYSWQGDRVDEFAESYNTIFEALRSQSEIPDHVILFEGITYDTTSDFRDEKIGNLNEFRRNAMKTDYIILAIGENSYCETPGNITELNLSENQQALVKIAAETKKPVILVLLQGRPRLIREIEPLAKSILHAYLPGNYGGDAVAGIIYGKINPSGKLPFTYPKYSYGTEPYFHKFTEQLEDGGGPPGTNFNPQYPFGFGLSYSKFEYSDLTIGQSKYSPGEIIKGSVRVKNISKRPGKEVVQVYISDHFASITPSVKRLRAFEKVMVEGGSEAIINFEIPVNELAFINHDNKKILEKGTFTLITGALKQDFKISETMVIDD